MMSNRVNLMPEHLLRKGEYRRSMHGALKCAGVLLVVLIVWICVMWGQVRDLDGQIAATEAVLQPLRVQHDKQRHLYNQHQVLAEQLRGIDALREPIPTGAVLALLTQVLPGDTALTSLIVDVPSPKSGRNPGRAEVQPNSDRLTESMTIRIEGFAISDIEVARMMDRFIEHEAFSSVDLDDSHEITVNGVRCYRFRMTLTIAMKATETTTQIPGRPES